MKSALVVVMCLALLFGVFPGNAVVRAADGVQWPERGTVRKAFEDYRSKLTTNAAMPETDKVNKDETQVLDGIRIPPDVAKSAKFLSGQIDVIIGLSTPPVTVVARDHSITLGDSLSESEQNIVTQAMNAVRADQEESILRVQSAGVSLGGLRRYSVAYNGIAGTVNVADLKTLANLFGAQNVHVSRTYVADLASSVPLIGAGTAGVWTNPGVDGTGMYVGVVDTGVDYTHPDFGGDGTNHGFPTAKIVAGYDFGDDDSNPMDTNGHGTHVSGIVAADGKVKGVAPKAKIVIAKIVQGGIGSASTEDIVAAFDYMADPTNVDGGPEGTHPPVASINMSFGAIAAFIDPTDPENIAIENCISNGIVVSLSAGNSANSYSGSGYMPFFPDYATVGAPSVTPGAISVASSENATIPGFAITEATSGTKVAYAEGSTSPNLRTVLGDNHGAGYPYVDCGLGQSADFVGKNLTGKIALIQRGTINFATKINNAAGAGAVAAVIYNNTTGTISMNTSGASLPSCSITMADGLTLKGLLTSNPARALKFLGDVVAPANPLVDTISSFSSWGAPPDLSFKPDLTAPGGNIWSTVPVAMGSYANYSGTSMASPHVAAAAALVKEAHPNWTVEQVKTALSNTAVLLKDPASNGGVGDVPYSPLLMGAGRINVANALSTSIIAVDAVSGAPYVTLGEISGVQQFRVKVSNTSNALLTARMSGNVQWTKRSNLAQYTVPGASILFNPSTVLLKPRSSTYVMVRLDLSSIAPDSGFFPYVDGFVTITPQRGTDGSEVHVPFTAYAAKWNEFDAAKWGYNPIVDPPADQFNFSRYYYGGRLPGVTWLEDGVDYNNLGTTFDGNLDRNAVAINPHNQGESYSSAQANLWVLRNAQNLTVSVTDNQGKLVKMIDSYDWLWKGNLASYGGQYSWLWSGNSDWTWFGQDTHGSIVPDGQYHVLLTATPQKMVGKSTFDPAQVVDLPIKVDTVSPVVNITSWGFGTTGHVWWNVSDPTPGSGIWGQMVWWSTDGVHWGYADVGPTVREYHAIPLGVKYVEVDAADNAFNIGFDVIQQGVSAWISDAPASLKRGTSAEMAFNVANFGVAQPHVRNDVSITVPAWLSVGDASTAAPADGIGFPVTLEYFDTAWHTVPLTGTNPLVGEIGAHTGFALAGGSVASQQLRLTVGPGVPIGDLRVNITNHVVDATGAITGTNASSSADLAIIDVPLAPAISAVTAGDGTLTVQWSAPDSQGSPIVGYDVYCSPGGGAVFTPGTSYTLSGLTNGTAYTVSVSAVNAAGEGPQSVPMTGTPAPLPASILRLVDVTGQYELYVDTQNKTVRLQGPDSYDSGVVGAQSFTFVPDVSLQFFASGANITLNGGFDLAHNSGAGICLDMVRGMMIQFSWAGGH